MDSHLVYLRYYIKYICVRERILFNQNMSRHPGKDQDFFRRIVDNAVTMQRVRIAYRFRHPVTYFPIEPESRKLS